MEEEEVLIQDSVSGASFENKIQKSFRHFVDLFYEVFYLLYKDYNSTNRFERTSKKIYIHCFFMMLYLLQLLSLTFPCSQIEDYQKYDWFFKLTAICRIDYLFVILGIGMVFYFIALFIVIIPVFSLGIIYYELLAGKRVKEANYRYTLVWPLKLTNEHLYISLFSIFATVFDVSIFSKIETYEYKGYDLTQLNIPYIGPASVIFMFLLLVISMMEQLFNTEQYITRSKAVPFARPHSRVEALKTLFITAFILSHHFIHESEIYTDNYGGHLALGLGGSSALAGLYIYYLPFYSQLVNFTHAAVFTSLSWGIFAQIISTSFQEVTLIFVFVLIMTPLLCILTWDLISKRKSYILTHYLYRFAKLPSIYECELTIRFEIEKYLKAKAEKDKVNKQHYREVIKDLFHILQKRFSYHKLPSIWEFIFFFHIIKRENIARLKLAQSLKGKYDIEASFYYYKYIKVMVDFSTTYSEEVDYIRFKQLYDKAKIQDEDTCRLQLDFWTELSHEHPNIKKLETLGEKLYSMIEKTNKACKKLYKKYPERALSLKLYGSFLMDVYNDTEKGNDLVSRGENLKWQTELKGFTGEKFSYFDENVGLLVVSGTPGSLGMVQYMSPEASEILGVPLKLSINMHICNFSLPPMNNVPLHNEVIARYLTKTDHSDIPLPFNFFILDSNSNLVEIYMQNRCVAIDSYPFFLVTMKRINKPRECLIYAEDFTVIAHTKEFATLIGYAESKSLIALNLSVVIPKVDKIYELNMTDNFIEYSTHSSVVYMKFENLSLGAVTYRLLYITSEISETKGFCNRVGLMNGFQDLLQSRFKTTSSIMPETSPEKRGILKDTRFKTPKKDLKVVFNDELQILIIQETDFQAGHNDPHKKDAAPIKKPKTAVLELEELDLSISITANIPQSSQEQAEAQINTNLEILDIKDLMDLTINEDGKTNSVAGSVAGVSVSEGIVKRSSASVASSAVSSNASVSSSATAQLLLSKVNGSMSKFKCTFLLTVVIVIVAVIAMMIYIIVTVDHYNETVLITEMSELRNNSILISEYIRFLQLMNAGYIPIIREDIYRSKLISTTTTFSSLIQKIYDEKDEWTDKNMNLLMDERIVTWNMYNTQSNMTKTSLIDSLRNIARESKILSDTELDEITIDNSHFYYIYRNGIGETLNQLNSTVYSFIDHEKENLDYILNIVLFLGISAITLMLICFVAVIIPTIISVEHSNQNVWKFFYKLPLDVVQEMKFRCEERLETLHGIDLEKKGTEQQKFKNMEKRELIKNSTKWPYIIFKLMIYYLLSAAFFIFFYFMVYQEFGYLLTNKPKVINWASMRTMSLHRGLFWFFENMLISTPVSLYDIVPNNDIIDNPLNNLRQDLDSMLYAEDLLLDGSVSGFGMTSEHEDLLLKNGCITTTCIYLKKGLHSSLINLEKDLLEYSHHNEFGYVDLLSIWERKQEVIDTLMKMVKLYEDEIDLMLERSRSLMIGITVCYSITVLVLYVFLYVPSINKIRLQVTQIWDNSRLIPIVLLDRIIRAWNKDGKKITF